MRGLFALVAALVALVAVPAAHEAAPSGTKIVYESYSDGDFELYAVDPETHAVRKLTNNTWEDSSPTPSPDGSKIAFYSATGTAVVNANGTGRRRLTGCFGYNLSWSPDSARIVCEGENGLAVVNADGTGAQSLGVDGYAPTWSPDGTTIAYVGADDGYMHAVDPDGANPRVLAAHHTSDLTLSTWSPDSSRLVFISEETGSLLNQVYLVRADGTGLNRLAANVYDERPAWSPDGTKIAFTGRPTKNSLAVYTIAPNGSGKALAAAGAHGESVTTPSWSPTGNQLSYVRARFAAYGIDGDVFAVNGDGIRRQVTFPFPSGASASDAAWAAGALQGGTPRPKISWLTLPKKQQVGNKPILATVFGTGATAAAPAQADCAPFVVWQTGKRSRSIDPCADVDVLLDLGVAGDRIAWVTAKFSHTEFPQYLEVKDPGRPISQLVSTAEADPETGAGDYVDSLHGDGSVLAFNFWHLDARGTVSNETTWRILPRQSPSAQRCPASTGDVAPGVAKRRCLRLRGGDGMDLLSVSSGKLVGAKRNGRVLVLRPDGHIARQGPLINPAQLLGATLQGKRLILLTRDSLLVGSHRFKLASGPDFPSPRLLSGYGNFVLYWRGAVHLMRLSDGRDRVLRAAGQAPPVGAQLGKKGLFYEYNQLYTKKPGRIVFVPWSRLALLLRTG
jgi:Tol biopolymer transport system component